MRSSIKARVPAAIAALSLTGCAARGIMDPVGPIAADEKQILINSTAIMLAIIVPVIVLTVAFAWWFRRGNTKAKYRPDWEFSGAIELVVWSVPALTVMLLGGLTWIASHDLDPMKPVPSKSGQTLNVQVVSLDWKWLFIYPDQGIATVNYMVVPAGTTVHFDLTSATVWNTFFVPQMGSMIYTMPRMPVGLNLRADLLGNFEGRSAHFSGDGFPGMEFNVLSVKPEQFATWAQQAKGQPALDYATYQKLSKPSRYVKHMTFSNVAPGLFQAVVSGKAPAPQPLPHNPPTAGSVG